MKTGSVNPQRSIASYLVIALKGLCMGAANIVPGVSGGTMAFILGIYEELIEAIRSFDLKFLRLVSSFRIRDAMDHISWQFLTAVGLGILMAIFSLARVLSWLLQNQKVLIWSFFFGLIIASVFTVSRFLRQWNLNVTVWMILGTIGAYFLFDIVPVSTPNTPWFLFISGVIAICSMILPGISGSFILLIIGKYHYVLEAVNNRDLFTLFIMATGAGFGLIAFSRFLNWLLRRHHDLTIAVLTGLMLGSLRKVWPWKNTLQSMTDNLGNVLPLVQANILPPRLDSETALALSLMVVGGLVVFSLDLCAKKKNGV